MQNASRRVFPDNQETRPNLSGEIESKADSKEPESKEPAPNSAWQLFLIWLAIGIQSFGGGPSLAYMIRQEMINKRGWLTENQFNHFSALSSITPGIFFISFAIITGKYLAGWRGILACLGGMLLPSTIITLIMTVGFAEVQHYSVVQAILNGVLPATIGLSLWGVVQIGRPLLLQAANLGKLNLGLQLTILIGSTVALGGLHLSAALVLLVAGISGAVLFPTLKVLKNKKRPAKERSK